MYNIYEVHDTDVVVALYIQLAQLPPQGQDHLKVGLLPMRLLSVRLLLDGTMHTHAGPPVQRRA